MKLQFFEEVSKLLNSFLHLFQSGKPMAPFLVESLETLSRTFCRRFIRKEILDAALTTLKFIKIDISDKCNQVNCAQFDLGFSIKHNLII